MFESLRKVFSASKGQPIAQGGGSFPVGPTGPVPLSSASLNAQLIAAATAEGGGHQTLIKEILDYVVSENYDAALAGIDSMMRQEQLSDVRELLIWTKSNIFQRRRQTSREIDELATVSALKEHPLFELNLGIAYSRESNRKEAEVHFSRAIELMDGKYPLATFNLGILYCDTGRSREARLRLEDLESGKEKVPSQLIQKLKDRVSSMR